MPILYKGDARVMFAHVPKTAGSSLYSWFAQSGWQISNLSRDPRGTSGMLEKAYPGCLKDDEGNARGNSTLQHAPAEIYTQWGPFTDGFMMVRHPMARYASELKFIFPRYCRRWKIATRDQDSFDAFCTRFTQTFLSRITRNPELEDNHLRPQRDFWSMGQTVYRLEDADWSTRMAEQFDLKGDPPRHNVSNKRVPFEVRLDEDSRNKVMQFYRPDFASFGYL